ncbi:MAG: aminotransferase class I/II-fold pyridoxal phosphate-dependent enzyme [Eubacteriales bacterium]|nr:aminotransferase class I/II-fold pyridoxal phosphate-dependent enzyme [Eubacteriales bacterium]
MSGLYDKLKEYGKSDYYPFHMPGHKRSLGAVPEVRDIDITEIEGFDNLHHPEGILRDAQKKAADLYGSQETYYLINGSTSGILTAIFACTNQRGKILMARNSHKAAYHAAEIRELKAVYLYPREIGEMTLPGGSILPEDVRTALEKDKEIEAVFVTSPTYEGVVSDIKKIAEIAHSFGKPLIVDEAHGAHFGFHPVFPQSSVKLGADIVIHSLHKTMPSLTQTALLHRNGILTDGDTIRKYLGIFQTSSPSYVLMAGIDVCVEMTEMKGTELFRKFAKCLEEFYDSSRNLKMIRVLQGGMRNGDMFDRDLSKIIIEARGKSGRWLAERLRETYHLEPEMETGTYVVALTSVGDSREGFDRLSKALQKIDEELCSKPVDNTREEAGKKPYRGIRHQDSAVMTIAQAGRCEHETISLNESTGCVSGEYIYLYPPGIPMIVPGEKISKELLKSLEWYQREGFSLQGMKDYTGNNIDICKQNIFIV